jgi:hypothetical protein
MRRPRFGASRAISSLVGQPRVSALPREQIDIPNAKPGLDVMEKLKKLTLDS